MSRRRVPPHSERRWSSARGQATVFPLANGHRTIQNANAKGEIR
nr:MAG TPA: hypothetical protein [Caudoviricetes sp.]